MLQAGIRWKQISSSSFEMEESGDRNGLIIYSSAMLNKADTAAWDNPVCGLICKADVITHVTLKHAQQSGYSITSG
jgi:hypothetical protein